MEEASKQFVELEEEEREREKKERLQREKLESVDVSHSVLTNNVLEKLLDLSGGGGWACRSTCTV